MRAGTVIGVVGSARPLGQGYELARLVGLGLARAGAIVICGGLSGVMEAAAKGVFEGNGVSIGLLPGADRSQANRYMTVVLPTDLGHARNVIIATAAQGLIAIQGGRGTISEIALGLKMGKPVVGLDCPHDLEGMVRVEGPEKAVEKILSLIPQS
jgi:uncharacterized protein (TIGR00725 family)